MTALILLATLISPVRDLVHLLDSLDAEYQRQARIEQLSRELLIINTNGYQSHAIALANAYAHARMDAAEFLALDPRSAFSQIGSLHDLEELTFETCGRLNRLMESIEPLVTQPLPVRCSMVEATWNGCFTTVDIELESGLIEQIDRSQIEVTQRDRVLHHAVLLMQKDAAPPKSSIAIVLDRSGSTKQVLPAVKTAVQEFLGTILPKHRVKLYTFNDRIESLTDWSSDPVMFQNVLQGIASDGGTRFFEARKRASQDLASQPGVRSMLLFSDGRDSNTNAIKSDTDDAFDREKGIRVYPIAINTPDDHTSLLQSIADSTEGSLHSVSDLETLRQAMLQIASQVEKRPLQLLLLDPIDPNEPITVRIAGESHTVTLRQVN